MLCAHTSAPMSVWVNKQDVVSGGCSFNSAIFIMVLISMTLGENNFGLLSVESPASMATIIFLEQQY